MTLAIAHRGEPIGQVENTIESVRAAIDAGADMVEIDVRLSADGVPVLLHDADLGRIWGIDAPVASLTLDDLGRARGPRGERIPTLADAARLITGDGRQIMVDLPEPAAIGAGYRVLRDLGVLESCLFAGRSPLMRTEMPTVRVALSWDDIELPDEDTLAYYRPEYFNPHFQLLTAGVADLMHERGIGISVWTVDHPRDMAAVIVQGADAVISNRIADLVTVIKEQS